jgi:uncharacterized protein
MAKNFRVMLKTTGAKCNLACQYCFYLNKESLYPSGTFKISDELLEEYTKQYMESQSTPEVSFDWQGGEPSLLGIDFYRKAVKSQKKYAKVAQKGVNSFQTNGLLLDAEWCKFFKENNFLVGLSLDGPQELHDKYRFDKGKNPTHSGVESALKLLQDYGVDYNILCCVSNSNVEYPLEVYSYFRSMGVEKIQFIPVVNKSQIPGEVTPESITGKQYGDFLISVFDEWYRRDVGSIFIFLFEHFAARLVGRHPGLCVFETTCGLELALEHTGDLYSCDHYVSPDYLLGNIFTTNIADLVYTKQQYDFALEKAELPTKCLECDVRFICNGGCPKNRITLHNNEENKLNYLCEGYYSFFNHSKEPLRKLLNV